jgi:hypothetical protein
MNLENDNGNHGCLCHRWTWPFGLLRRHPSATARCGPATCLAPPPPGTASGLEDKPFQAPLDSAPERDRFGERKSSRTNRYRQQYVELMAAT